MGMSEEFEREMKRMKTNSRLALLDIADQIHSDSIDFVPMASSLLRKSFDSDVIERTGRQVLTVGYYTDYAEKQHEEILNHVTKQPFKVGFQDAAGFQQVGEKWKYYWKGYWIKLKKGGFWKGQAKFLETPFLKNINKYLELYRTQLERRNGYK